MGKTGRKKGGFTHYNERPGPGRTAARAERRLVTGDSITTISGLMPHSKAMKKVLRDSRKQSARYYTDDYRLVRWPRIKVLPGTRQFYDRARQFFDSVGFKRIGDYRLASMPRATPAYRTPLRFYRSIDGFTVADAYYLQVTRMRHLQLRYGSGLPAPLTFDFTTEFTDGGFLETSSGKAASLIDLPKSILRVFAEPDEPPTKVWQAHQKALAAQRKLGRSPIPILSEQEMLASAVRLHLVKSAYREKVKHVRMSEVQAIARNRKEKGYDIDQSILKVIADLSAALEKKARAAKKSG